MNLDSDATKKINGFSAQSSFTNVIVYTGFILEEIELVLAEEY